MTLWSVFDLSVFDFFIYNLSTSELSTSKLSTFEFIACCFYSAQISNACFRPDASISTNTDLATLKPPTSQPLLRHQQTPTEKPRLVHGHPHQLFGHFHGNFVMRDVDKLHRS